MQNIFFHILLLSLLCACATDVPLEIRQDISESRASINAVRSDFSRYEGADVRWGGTIAAVENNQSDTWIEVVGRDLGSYGQPVNLDRNREQGRFLVRVNGFLDPAIYSVNRGITVYGTVESKVVRSIDNYPYAYPLLKAKSHYLWSDRQIYPYYANYYYPYYPYYYPYRFSFGFGYGFGHHHHYGFGMHNYYGW